MANRGKSQWDFGGELFPPEQTRKVWSVSELTGRVKQLLEQQLGSVWITGEVTNLRVQSSGHAYFTVKDSGAQLSCVLFRNEPVAHRDLLQDGQKLLLQGDVTVYEARGQYQLIVRAVELQGIGALQLAFERLKRKLEAEGLFAAERKRPLPEYLRRIGIVASPTGAAIRDVLHVVQRRNPGLEIVLAPCRVQGDGAAREIANAIRLLNEYSGRVVDRDAAGLDTKLDLILVTRGGGSLEDLWAFNEEVVARSIFDSALPVVSAIGHEIDFTISDFVADLRAATPSAAAEIITEGVFSSGPFVNGAAARLRQLFGEHVKEKSDDLSRLGARLSRMHPRRALNQWMQLLDDLQSGLLRCTRQGARRRRIEAQNLMLRLSRARPAQILRHRRELCARTEQRLREQVLHSLRDRQQTFAALGTRLRLLSPEHVLARGYSITTDAATGAVVRSAEKVKHGQELKTRLKKGEVLSRVESRNIEHRTSNTEHRSSSV